MQSQELNGEVEGPIYITLYSSDAVGRSTHTHTHGAVAVGAAFKLHSLTAAMIGAAHPTSAEDPR